MSEVIPVEVASQSAFLEQYITPLLPIAELLYYACGIGLFIVAIIGLKQLRLARKTAKVNSARESLKLSAEQCERYAKQIIPTARKLLETINASNLNDFFDAWEIKVSKTHIELIRNKKITSNIQPSQLPLNEICEVLNGIESFSQFFTCGLANELCAYHCLGKAHIDLVTKLLPFIIIHRTSSKHNYWKNTLCLYIIWKNRCEKETLSAKQKELQKALNSIEDVNIPIIDIDCE